MPTVIQKPREDKFNPEKLERLIQAAEQIEKTQAALPANIRRLYHKQRLMLLAKIKEETKKSAAESSQL